MDRDGNPAVLCVGLAWLHDRGAAQIGYRPMTGVSISDKVLALVEGLGAGEHGVSVFHTNVGGHADCGRSLGRSELSLRRKPDVTLVQNVGLRDHAVPRWSTRPGFVQPIKRVFSTIYQPTVKSRPSSEESDFAKQRDLSSHRPVLEVSVQPVESWGIAAGEILSRQPHLTLAYIFVTLVILLGFAV